MSASCPLCGQPASFFFLTQDLNRRLSPAVFKYYQCLICGLIFLSPIPDDLDAYYPSTYYLVPTSLDQFASQAEGERYKIEMIRKFVSAGRLLEIGPAYGSFAYLAKQAGFEVETIEMDGACCRFLREVVGVCAIQSQDPCAALSEMGTYNVITLWQVIEHVPDPWLLLKKMVDHLLPGGILVIAAPNPDAFQFQILGRWWTHVDAPRHLELIPISLLTQQTRALNLKPVLLTTTDEGSLGWNSFGWQMSLRNLFLPHRWLRRLMRLIGLIVGVVLYPLECREGWGSAYTAVFQKAKHI